MSIKTIAAILTEPGSAKAVLSTATALAALHDAHIIALHGEFVDPPPVLSPMDLPDASIITALYDAASTKTGELEALYADAIAHNPGSSEWRPFKGTTGSAMDGLVESARTSDIVVAPQPPQGQVGSLDQILFDSGRPVLFIPWIDKEYKVFNRILIAWDGSRVATRAVFDALPLLKMASEIEIFTIDAKDTSSQDGAMAGTELAATLARHGLKVSVRGQASESLPVSAVLENRCSDFGADLLVMGAYGSSRLMERIFGGATQMLLESMTVPVLMSR